jgi:putative redox protein
MASGACRRERGSRWHHGAVKTRTSTLTLAGDDLRFQTLTESGHPILVDSDGIEGPRPTELLGVALAGCTSMDVISILRKKRQPIDRYRVRVTSHQVDEPPHNFVRVDVDHEFEGAVDAVAVERALELSCAKYCSVGVTLAAGTVEVRNRYRIRRPDGTELTGEVAAAGPGVSPAQLAARV